MTNVETPRTTDQGQRTKRKYTVSDKVRAANRLNLPKALSVDKKIRYRLTPKRLAANRANLRKALQARRYKRYARDWVRAVDLRKSALRAGGDAGGVRPPPEVSGTGAAGGGRAAAQRGAGIRPGLVATAAPVWQPGAARAVQVLPGVGGGRGGGPEPGLGAGAAV